ncbi:MULTISPECIES: acyl-CoA dehydrogenase family protein [unclassified Arthrobacter]|uniref:acyl-CoA dehydrogenase family protein n=1 Tax=unclassified Arthrobacter TaxID=235627 RepID=UPI001E302ACB|nr:MULTISPECIES: acyl-CoA dehydrogenase family protein [unclassified Arthrobacter]MCC9145267.1 acyl-CoA dehydrogenase family protein [Arthrobacter sp. zg-Y919]MDK1276495.1 acyl-CoA dehydrogenase family protein [Arthrobacter sp. zg.Y919]WIB01910.1 acyl-CoA dehydrogenase family protein [Arthrobacter sp. zg-Y919]
MTVTQSARPAFDPTAVADVDADLYLLDELLDDEARDVRDRVRAFVDNDLLPVINDYWERAEVPYELVPKLAALNIAGGTIKGYGCPGMSRMAASTAAAELARGDGSINTFFGVHSGLAMGSIDMLGSEEQKQRWLPAMARFEKIGAFALTEPSHGSDSVSLETSARRDGDSYVLNGNKRWIGNASFADIVIIYARDEADGAVKAFVMEKDADGNHPAGYRADVITGKIGKRAVLQPDIVIEDLRIPAENRLANCNSFKDVNKVLAATRGGVAWEALGHAVAAYEIAVAYAKDRMQFGRPIAGFQLVQNKLANMLAQVTAIKLTCFRLNELGDQGKMTGPMASMAKMFAARQGRWVCSEARDIMGGNGLLLENHVARHLTDMEVVFTYEGTDSMQSLILGRHITGLSAFA